MSADKDVTLCLTHILKFVKSANKIYCVHVCRAILPIVSLLIILQAKHPRALTANDLRNMLLKIRPSGGQEAPVTSGGIAEGVLSALEDCRVADVSEEMALPRVVVVCGSAFIMAEARAALGIIEPRDGNILFGDSSNKSTTLSDTQVCVITSTLIFLFISDFTGNFRT